MAAPLDPFTGLRAHIDASVEGVRARSEQVKAALDRYVEGSRLALVQDLEVFAGMRAAREVDMEALALEVLGAVDQLSHIGRVRAALEPAPAAPKSVALSLPAPRPVLAAVPVRAPIAVFAPAIMGEIPPPDLEARDTEVAPPPPIAVDEDEEHETGAGLARDLPLNLPSLREWTASAPLLIVGGMVIRPRLDWVQRVAGPVEWVPCYHGDLRLVQAAERRVRGARFGAVVVLQSLMSHNATDGMVDAARTANVPYVLAGKGTTAQMTIGLKQLDAAIATGASRVAGRAGR